MRSLKTIIYFVVLLISWVSLVSPVTAATQSGSIGVEGTVPGTPPTRGATITFPKSGQVFNANPINVTGICPTGLLVKLFKNGVFGGSAQCSGGNFSITTDLFNGRNDLVARVYDNLDQAGPDSNTVTVNFISTTGVVGNSLTLGSSYAKRGANPGETLTWPFSITGGQAPYAISISWGDSQAPDLISRPTAGNFNTQHVYSTPGVYKIIVKATDKAGNTAFLQVVGVANGALSQANSKPVGPSVITRTVMPWWPLPLCILFIMVSFWLGGRHAVYSLRKRLEAQSN